MKDYLAGLFAGKAESIKIISLKSPLQKKTNHFLGVTTTFIVHPIDTIKVTMQYHSTHSIPKAIKLIIKLNSVREYTKLFLCCY